MLAERDYTSFPFFGYLENPVRSTAKVQWIRDVDPFRPAKPEQAYCWSRRLLPGLGWVAGGGDATCGATDGGLANRGAAAGGGLAGCGRTMGAAVCGGWARGTCAWRGWAIVLAGGLNCGRWDGTVTGAVACGLGRLICCAGAAGLKLGTAGERRGGACVNWGSRLTGGEPAFE